MTVRVVVTAASRHGATHEIATAIAAGLARRGVEAEAHPAEEVGSLDGYDAYVIGSAVYAGRGLDPARELVETYAAALAGRPVWLFSSGPLGPPEKLKPEGDPVDVAGLIETSSAVEHRASPAGSTASSSRSAKRRSWSPSARRKATSATGTRSTPSPQVSPSGGAGPNCGRVREAGIGRGMNYVRLGSETDANRT